MRRPLACCLFLLWLMIYGQSPAQEQSSAESRAARYYDSVRQDPPLLLKFLRDMPKGGDLHNHLVGAIYAESLIDFAALNGMCVDRATSTAVNDGCDKGCEPSARRPSARCAYGDQVLYNTLVDAWSMRNWQLGKESGHDHFFATFDKFFPATANHIGDALAETASRAAADRLQYVELMHTADGMRAAILGAKVGWHDDLPKMRDELLKGGLPAVVAATRRDLDVDEAKMRARLKCGTPQPDPGCGVVVRYLYQVLRGLPPEQVFAQILLGFELAHADSRFVGLNLVMPEDWYVPMRDFDLHMKMLDYLHGVYPGVHISLHAGELAMGLVAPEGLRFHIRESVERGHAERIGHGVDVMNETDPIGLLKELARRDILVEICLTSNDEILGVRGKQHPLAVYQQYGVPVALATDDEGVSRSDMTYEYLRAAEDQGLPYLTLKNMARQSLDHSFLPGASLWTDAKQFRLNPACAGEAGGSAKPLDRCRTFLDSSERARVQWKLEEEFTQFESRF